MNKSHDAHRRLNRIRGYFYRKGKTENRENTLFKIFINNSKAKIPFKWIPGFLSFSKLTVYINLKKIIKGYSTKKKIIYKIKPRLGRDSSQKSYLLLAPTVTKGSKIAKRFKGRLEKEFKGLRKTVFKRSTDLSKNEPVFFEKRDFLHKMAYSVLPKYRWIKKKKKIKKKKRKFRSKRKTFKKIYKKFIR